MVTICQTGKTCPCPFGLWGSKKWIIKEASSSITVIRGRKRNWDLSDKTVALIFLFLLFMMSSLFLWRLDDPVNHLAVLLFWFASQKILIAFTMLKALLRFWFSLLWCCKASLALPYQVQLINIKGVLLFVMALWSATYPLYAELALLSLIQCSCSRSLIDCLPHLHSITHVNIHMHLSGKLSLPEGPSAPSGGIF